VAAYIEVLVGVCVLYCSELDYLTILTTVTLASSNNVLPDDGVTAPKHVRAVIMSILILF
jgi:hypothetical protein